MDPSGLTLWRKTRPEFHVRKARVPFVSFAAVHCHPGLCGGGEGGGAVVTSGQSVRRVWESSSPSNRAGQTW